MSSPRKTELGNRWWVLKDPDLVYAAATTLAWRLLVEGYAILALNRVGNFTALQHKFYPLTVWTNWDGGNFLMISTQGYFTNILYAFFPLLPLLMHIISWPVVLVFGAKISVYIVSGLLINLVALMGTGYFLIKLARLDFDVDTGKRAWLLLLFSPAAIFLATLYSEPLFLFGIVAAWYFAKRRRWVWAGLLGLVAALTRQVGFLLIIPLAIEFMLSYRHELQRNWRRGLPLLLIPAGLGVYMIYLFIRTGNPVEFLTAEAHWQRQLSLQAPVDVYNQIISALDLRHFGPNNTAPLYDSLATLIFIGLATVLLIRRYYAYGVLMLLLLAPPLLSGQISGMVRFSLVLFPAYLLLGRLSSNPTVFALLLVSCAIFWALLSIHFLNGWWLA